ncbi:MAG TPA: hypothetical protein VLD67_20210 [Vicinamibacterales bacterium]|nr:hypothetical protein [Vicinamibacterales bacterium]
MKAGRRALALAAALAASTLPVTRPGAFAAAAVGPVPLLDVYATGDRERALGPVRSGATDAIPAFRRRLVTAGTTWLDREPEARPRRLLIAALFALETEVIHAERGQWAVVGSVEKNEVPCAGRCVVEWACGLLRERGAPDEFERLWLLASVALTGGVRDWTFLLSPLVPRSARTIQQGHLLHAIERVPDEPRLRLARAVAIASRYGVMTELEAPRAGERTGSARDGAREIEIVLGPGLSSVVSDRRRSALEHALAQLGALESDPVVGPEAAARRAYLQFRTGAYEDALAGARASAAAATTADIRYLAHYLAGQSAQTLGDFVSAEAHYSSALEAREDSQSAAIALAALTFLRGDADAAYTLAASSVRVRPGDDDPWRMFLYGDFARLSGLLDELRGMIGR